jgi:CRP-like cAMP-binding protein
VDAAELAGIPLFAGLGSSTREQVARLSDELDVPAGKELAHQGNFAHEFFVILDGRAEVTQDGRLVRELGPGDFFGEIGVLESERRTATVTAATPMRLAVLFAPSFRQIEATMPEVAREVRAAIRDRLAASGQSST